MRVLIFLAALFALISYVYAGNWAVIVAGSNTYGNYRHQSDACHAYQVCKKFGIPENQIILMAYDDIANDKENPYPGKIFNKPTAKGTPGTDVYAGCKIAYSKNTVTAANFLAVIQGQSSKVPAGHPVLNTTAEDNIFIYYTDHGAVGIVAMPVGDDLYATDLNTALQSMYKAKKFGKLVFYLEACESGSMFEGILPTNINIYATTASSAEESSYGTYCPPDDMVNGKEINSCLGDEYSVNWMENSDSAGAKETIADQITIVTQETKLSGVHQYGSTSFTNLAIGQFQGGMNNATSRRSFDALEQAFAKRAALNSQGSKIDSRDIALHLAYSKYQRAVARKAPAAEVESALNALQAELATRGYADEFFNLLSTTIKADGSLSARSTLPVTGTACQKAVDSAIGKCSVWNDYSRKYHNIVVNACMDPEACSASLVDTVNSVCAQLPKPANYKF